LIRVTPDTNVLISAFLFKGNERIVLRYAIEGEIRFVLSSELLDEMIRILDEKFHLETDKITDYLLRLSDVTEIVKPKQIRSLRIRDREDAKVIECASTGRSSYILTGDRDLLSIGHYKEIRIVPARRFLKLSGRLKD